VAPSHHASGDQSSENRLCIFRPLAFNQLVANSEQACFISIMCALHYRTIALVVLEVIEGEGLAGHEFAHRRRSPDVFSRNFESEEAR
jgi:hypothetical protein